MKKYTLHLLFTLILCFFVSDAFAGLRVKCDYNVVTGDLQSHIFGGGPGQSFFMSYMNDQRYDSYYFPSFPSHYANKNIACKAICKAFGVYRSIEMSRLTGQHFVFSGEVTSCEDCNDGDTPSRSLIVDKETSSFQRPAEFYDWESIEKYLNYNTAPYFIGLAAAIHLNLKEALRLDLIEIDAKQSLIVTGVGAGTLAVLSARSGLRSLLFSSISKSKGFLPGVALTLLTAPLQGSSHPMNHVREKPWIFPDLSLDQQRSIIESHPDVAKIVTTFNEDLKNMISTYKAERQLNCSLLGVDEGNLELIKATICPEDAEEYELEIRY